MLKKQGKTAGFTENSFLNEAETMQLEVCKECEEILPGRTIQLGIEAVDMIRYKCPDDLSLIDVC